MRTWWVLAHHGRHAKTGSAGADVGYWDNMVDMTRQKLREHVLGCGTNMVGMPRQKVREHVLGWVLLYSFSRGPSRAHPRAFVGAWNRGMRGRCGCYLPRGEAGRGTNSEVLFRPIGRGGQEGLQGREQAQRRLQERAGGFLEGPRRQHQQGHPARQSLFSGRAACLQ